MQSLSTGAFKYCLEPFLLEPLPQVLRGKFKRFEWYIRCGVKIENEPVGTIDVVDARAPWVDLDGPHLDHFQQTFFILDIEVLEHLPFVTELKRMHIRPQSLAGVALVETLAIDAGRTPQEAQGTSRDGG